MPTYGSDPRAFNAIQDWMRARDYIGGQFDEPRYPGFPQYQGLSGREESGILDAIRRRISETTNKNLRATRNSAASRGAYRSGQLPQLEAGVYRSGQDAEANALAQYYASKAGRLQSWNQQRAASMLDQYRSQRGEYRSDIAGAGQIFGQYYRPR